MALILCCDLSEKVSAQPLDLSGTTDDSIRNVVRIVADRQLRATATNSAPRILVDGSYPVATSLAAATNAAKPQGIQWDYPWGVNLYGLLQSYRATGDTNYLNFVLNQNLIVARYYAWLRSLHDSLTNTTGLAAFQQSTVLGELFILDRLDFCGAMTAQFLEGVQQYAGAITSEQALLACIGANYVSRLQARLPDGTLWRPTVQGGTIWADDLYMSCPALIRWYQYTGDSGYLDDAALQVKNMAGYLQDTNGLWFHGYFYNAHTNSGFKWGRANGWAMVATAEVLSAMPTSHPAHSNLLSILRRHIEGIKSVQTVTGMWRQLLDQPSLWEETSCTAMFSYSIARAVNRGWIDAANLENARRGFAGLCVNITTNGQVNGTCAGTGIGTSLSFYANRPRPADDMHGRGAVTLAGAEILLHPKLHVAAVANQAEVSWPAGLFEATLEVSPNLTGWSLCTNSPKTNSFFQKFVADPLADAGFYRLRLAGPAAPPARIPFEAESLAWTTHGAAASVSPLDSNASGGYFVTLNGDGPGDFIEFTLPNVPAGTYRLKMHFKSNTDRGVISVSLDDNPVGGPLDEYFYSVVYPLMDFGPVTLSSSGDHLLRLTVTGKHGASAGYTSTADAFILEPE